MNYWLEREFNCFMAPVVVAPLTSLVLGIGRVKQGFEPHKSCFVLRWGLGKCGPITTGKPIGFGLLKRDGCIKEILPELFEKVAVGYYSRQN
ncbi:hypothetical protein MON38_22150 [Hymenobacter sp. DH14]|uniref:Uncharacterized protein n=1 Tax=Hymenobacter cyanobacteriorum TaxID=2926463 RepID=A0A9X1VJU7_9BACT|nr:hypothetical protein [Hymenobacter cyanobacteriorum]MCI1190137.1 hypothetical protein [Hymenobacter cyanobacteriorum]